MFLFLLILVTVVSSNPINNYDDICGTISPCGFRAICENTSQNYAICKCPTNHSGNAFVECIANSDYGGTRNNYVPHQQNQNFHQFLPINATLSAIFNGNNCGKVCGTNAICSFRNNRPLCVCLEGYIGNPFVRCEQKSSKCQKHNDCDGHLICINSACQDSCNEFRCVYVRKINET